MTAIEDTEEKSIRNSLGVYGLVSFLIFLLYTFIVPLGIFMFLTTVQLGFFGGEGEGFFIIPDVNLTGLFEWLLSFEWFVRFLNDWLFLLAIFYIYTIVVWIYVYYSTVKPIYYGKEKSMEKKKEYSFLDPRDIGWYLKFISIFFSPAIMLVQILPFRAENVPYKRDLNLRIYQ
ncbi:MAG: hypothetical protein ACXAC8_06585 [Candidatus Hodarchaeales archaeon]